jgi:hypothetical protein
LVHLFVFLHFIIRNIQGEIDLTCLEREAKSGGFVEVLGSVIIFITSGTGT